MKVLNRRGIVKVIKYLGEDRFTVSTSNGINCIFGNVTKEDKDKLDEIGVRLYSCSDDNMLSEAVLDDTEVESDQESSDNNEIGNSDINDSKARDLAKSIIPYLKEYFPSKDEINDILEKFRAQSIDPEEMINGLKMQIRRIKKHSKENDEIG